MKTRLFKCIAALVIACTLSLSLTSCSQPIDNGSRIPAQSQPLVALLALIGVGIGLVALHHHNVKNSGGGPGPGATITPPISVQGLGIGAIDIALDTTQPGSTGALGKQGAGGRYVFSEVNTTTANAGSYTLPAGYQPFALAIDASGNDWFLDTTGAIKKCAPPTPTVTVCVPLVSIVDGLPLGGTRSIAADNFHIFIAQDNGNGTVTWATFALDGSAASRLTGTYSYGTGLGIFSKDAVQNTTNGFTVSQFTVMHLDGTSWVVALGTSTAKNPFTFSPRPIASGNVATFDNANFYGFLGSTTLGAYQFGHWVGVGSSLGIPGALVGSVTIASDGQINPNAGFFSLPLSALRQDGFALYALDPAGNLVIFRLF